MMIIGSHVSFGSQQLLGSVKEAISYGANTFMFYTGAPQNTIRKDLNKDFILEALNLMKENDINIEKVICHAPYIVNLANDLDERKYNFSINFLKNEIARCEQMGVKYIVLHPGSSVGIERSIALDNIVLALNKIIEKDTKVTVLLETMAGKGTEIGCTLEEIKYILDGVNLKDKIGVCLDTCHLNDAGYDMSNFEQFLVLFDDMIGLDKIGCVHVNDSKNEFGSHKDRHANIGLGTLGFVSILKIVQNEKLKDIPKILETPYIGENDDDKNRIYPPYKFEIEMLKSEKFDDNLMSNIRNYYKDN